MSSTSGLKLNSDEVEIHSALAAFGAGGLDDEIEAAACESKERGGMVRLGLSSLGNGSYEFGT